MNIDKLERWSKEFGLSKHSIVERSLQSLDVVIIILEQFRDAKAAERGVRAMVGAYNPGNFSPADLGVPPNFAPYVVKGIRFNISSHADGILNGLAILLELPKSEVIDQSLQLGAVETAIRKELNSSIR